MPLIKWIDKLLDWVAIAALVLMLSLVSIQVFYRYVLNDPIGYAQEISIYSMMLFVMIGMAKAFHHNEHIAVTYFVDRMPRLLSCISAVVTGIIVLCFQVTMTYQCWLLAQRAMRQISPTTGVPVGYVVMFLCVGFALSTIYLLAYYLRTFRHYSHNKNLNQHLDDDSSIRKEQF